MKLRLSKMRIKISELIGRLLNLAGVPGFASDCSYQASTYKAEVSVRRSPLYTIVTVNGLDIYFHRMTGRIDGVGFRSESGLDETKQ